jgi:hypothetical protein
MMKDAKKDQVSKWRRYWWMKLDRQVGSSRRICPFWTRPLTVYFILLAISVPLVFIVDGLLTRQGHYGPALFLLMFSPVIFLIVHSFILEPYFEVPLWEAQDSPYLPRITLCSGWFSVTTVILGYVHISSSIKLYSATKIVALKTLPVDSSNCSLLSSIDESTDLANYSFVEFDQGELYVPNRSLIRTSQNATNVISDYAYCINCLVPMHPSEDLEDCLNINVWMARIVCLANSDQIKHPELMQLTGNNPCRYFLAEPLLAFMDQRQVEKLTAEIVAEFTMLLEGNETMVQLAETIRRIATINLEIDGAEWFIYRQYEFENAYLPGEYIRALERIINDNKSHSEHFNPGAENLVIAFNDQNRTWFQEEIKVLSGYEWLFYVALDLPLWVLTVPILLLMKACCQVQILGEYPI